MDNRIIDEIIDEYEAQRAKNADERSRRIERAYRLVPELREIDRETARIGSETLHSILSSGSGFARADMSKKFRALRERKAQLLELNKISPDYDKLPCRCSLCGDSGYIEGKGRCSCFKQRMIDKLYAKSNMKDLLKTQSFESFDISYYPKTPVKGLQKSAYENMLIVKKNCEEFAWSAGEKHKNLIFSGDTGLGKTFMSTCIAKEFMKRGKTVLYLRAIRLFRMLEDDRFGRADDEISELYDCDLLIIDDVGTETMSKNNSMYLLDLLNERLDSNKKIIMSTNLNFKQLEEKYTKRFSSRLMESFDFMRFYGEDIRRLKLFNR